MSSTVSSSPKKPPSSTSSSERRPPSSNLNRSPSRMAAQTSSNASTPTTVNKTRSIRNANGTPVSARAAARKPNMSVSDVSLDTTTTNSSFANEELQARISDLSEKLQHHELAYQESQNQISVLQIKLDEALKGQGMLEESVHEHAERVEEMEVEKKESLRARRELEQIYETERASNLREKEESEREREAMVENMRRLKETLAHKEMRDRVGGVDDEEGRRPSVSRTSSLRSEDDSSKAFAPSHPGLQRSDSRNNSRLVLQKDKVIEELRLELADAQIRIVELENKGGSSLQHLEKECYDVKVQNARLMEENESFQLLLSEKTLNGDLAESSLLRPPSHTGSPRGSRPPPRHRASLADELADEDSVEEGDVGHAGEGGDSSRVKALRAEVQSMKDQNKALTLYINNIISRLLQHEQFEAILDKTPDLMAGPGAASRKFKAQDGAVSAPRASEEVRDREEGLGRRGSEVPVVQEQQSGGGGLLQRASSVLRRKPRPVSQLPPATAEYPRVDEPTVHNDPSTAPSIPLSQTSSRGSNNAAHRRSRSDWGAGAAAVVGSMYRGGASLGPQGPLSPALSPGLGSAPANRTSFFSPPLPASPLPPPSEDGELGKENDVPEGQQQHRDSKVSSLGSLSPERISNPNRNSIISSGNPDVEPPAASLPSTSSNPSSPPRSITSSSGEIRDGKAPSGAIMMGSKPRPLRLVQEAEEEKKGSNANRQSWFGWMGKTAGDKGFGGFLQKEGSSSGQ